MRDVRIEQRLTAQRVDWRYEDCIALTDIDAKASRANQARHEPIDDALVERYCLDMIDGVAFPAVVAERNKSGKYVLLDGNHRCAASLMAEKTSIDLYEVKLPSDYVRALLIRTLNLLEGKTLTKEEVLEHAAYLVNHYGKTKEAVAAELRLKSHTLTDYMRYCNTLQSLEHSGVVNAKALKQTSVLALHAISLEAPQASAAQLVLDAHMLGSEVDALVKAVRQAPTEKRQLEVIEENRENLLGRIQGTRRSTSPARSRQELRGMRLIKAVDTALAELVNVKTFDEIGIMVEQVRRVLVQDADTLSRKVTVLWLGGKGKDEEGVTKSNPGTIG
jgi:ParB-like chromosome segregation protein Spo0J